METEFFFRDEDAIRKNEIESIISEHWILLDKYFINKDGSIDVNGNVKFAENLRFLKELPLIFNKVTGNFDCSKLSLLSLKGSPAEVGGTFNCSYNKLITLEFLPKKASLFIFDNTVKSLYTGEVNSNFNDAVMVCRTNISAESISKKLSDLEEYFTVIFKYQNYYDVWNNDKSLNEKNLEVLVKDLRDGLE